MNVTSPDISTVQIKSTFDISGTLPAIALENLSTGTNLAACLWWFVVTAPGDIPIHTGSETSPDITGEWTTFMLNDSWPRVFNNIIWSGAPYIITTYVKDGTGAIFSISQSASICRPQGNTPTSTNTYGLGAAEITVQCQQARVFFQDITNASYKGIEGTQISSVLRVIYPVDETGNIPPPFVASNFTAASVPITYSSDTYQYQSYSVYDY